MDPERLIQGLKTVSDQVRVLEAAGYSTTEIGKILGKRYQHVRNVLRSATPEQMRRAQAHVKRVGEGGAPGVAEEGAEWIGPEMAENTWPVRSEPAYESRGPDAWRLVIGPGGSLTLPPELLAALDLRPGRAMVARLEGQDLNLISTMEGFRRLKALVPPWKPGEPMASEELIAERRAEAAREDADE
ncbi:MAG: hypothetical protein JWM33_3260 [Caulobacteraceae bacterium]|nr:hypothetical protein [Caulobacteraceae bacterium]